MSIISEDGSHLTAPTGMDLRLGVALACTESSCQVMPLDGETPIEASYAHPMIKHHIRVQPGKLIAVDYSSVQPRVVYRWEDVEVTKDASGYTLVREGDPVDADGLRAEYFPKIQAMYAQYKASPTAPQWLDVSALSFNSLLLLERVQISWFPGWLPETELATALGANPVVEWYLRHKCPEVNEWLDDVMSRAAEDQLPGEVRQAEEAIMRTINDLLTYVVDPATYDAQLFLEWDSSELASLVDFTGKTVIDVGSGTGRLAMVAAEKAQAVYAVEPVANLRSYIKDKARKRGRKNVFVLDGLITDLPFADGFADVTMGGHVFGDQPESEYQEMLRVTRPGGLVVLCPGNTDQDNDRHHFLVSKGFEWGRFEEPGEEMVRKYWQRA